MHSPHHHAKMARFYYNGHALGLKHFGKSKCDLFGKTFLDLQATGEHFGDASQFGEADHAAVGYVTNVHLE